MVTSLTNVTGTVARFLLSAAVLCFNGPRLVGSDGWARSATVETRPENSKKAEFHATFTVGKGNRQVTVELEFGRTRERVEEEGL